MRSIHSCVMLTCALVLTAACGDAYRDASPTAASVVGGATAATSQVTLEGRPGSTPGARPIRGRNLSGIIAIGKGPLLTCVSGSFAGFVGDDLGDDRVVDGAFVFADGAGVPVVLTNERDSARGFSLNFESIDGRFYGGQTCGTSPSGASILLKDVSGRINGFYFDDIIIGFERRFHRGTGLLIPAVQ